MKLWLARALALAGLLLFGLVLSMVLAPHGLAWIGWTLSGVAAFVFVAELAGRALSHGRETRDWHRWERSIDAPAERRESIRELRAAIDRARPFGARLGAKRARLSVMLAELLEADGRGEEAIRALTTVPLEPLADVQAALVRASRAQAYLFLGDLESAEDVLSMVGDHTGDEVLDASLSLARAALALGRGDPDGAEERASAVAAIAEEGDMLHDEALAIVAACRAVSGDPEGARAIANTMSALGRRRLALVAPAAVRAALEGLWS